MPVPTAWGAEFLINGQITGAQSGSTVRVLRDGRILVAWADYSQTSGDIRLRIFNADGSAATGEIAVNNDTALVQHDPSITQLDDGNVVIAWHSGDGNTDDIRMRLFSPGGIAIGNEVVATSLTAADQREPSIVATTNGLYVVFTDGNATDAAHGAAQLSPRNVRIQAFDSNLTRIGPAVDPILHEETIGGTPGLANGQGRSATARLADGRLVVVWEDDNTASANNADDVRVRILNNDLTTSVAPFSVNTFYDGSGSNNAALEPAVAALRDGGFVAVWSYDSLATSGDQGDIRARVFDANGSAVTAETAVTGEPIFILASGQSNFSYNPAYTWAPPANLTRWNNGLNSAGTGTAFVAPDTTTIDGSIAYAAEIARANPTRPVHVLTVAIGGQPIAQWLPGAQTVGGVSYDMYQAILDNIASAMAAAGVTQISELLWWQGEADAARYNGPYEADFEMLMDRFGAQSWFPSDTRTVVFGINGNHNAEWANFVLAQQRIVAVDPDHRDYVDATSLPGSTWIDTVHGSATGYAAIGELGYESTGGAARTTVDDFAISTAANRQFRPVVTGLNDGRFAVAWATETAPSSATILTRVYNSDGTALTDELVVSMQGTIDTAATASNIEIASIAGLLDGRYVVSWSDASQTLGDASTAGVHARIFDARTEALTILGADVAGQYYGTDFLIGPAALPSRSFADLIRGGGLADMIDGAGGPDGLYGGGGSDIVHGGVGDDFVSGGGIITSVLPDGESDQLYGDAGNDRIVYDAADDPAFILGGADFDTLLFHGSTAPTSFNLAAHEFEAAQGLVTDTTGQLWRLITTNFNSAWQVETERVDNDDDSYKFTTFDTAGTLGGLHHYIDYSTVAGVRTAQEGYNDFPNANGFVLARTGIYYPSGTANSIDDFNTAGIRISQEYFRLDGTREVSTIWDAEGSLGAIDFYQDFFSAAGLRTSQTVYYDGRGDGAGAGVTLGGHAGVDYQTTIWSNAAFTHGTQQGFDQGNPGTALFTFVF